MARPKTKSALVDGMAELVGSLRNIESKLGLLLTSQKRKISPGPGRPPGSGNKRKPRPAGGSGRGPGRPPGARGKRKAGRPAAKRRRRPAGSKNKK